jgi:hypothetical protein
MDPKITRTEAVAQLANLAQEVEITDPIDWKTLNITEQDAYELMANSVLDQFGSVEEKYKEPIMMSTIVKLLVENFVLNIKLHR